MLESLTLSNYSVTLRTVAQADIEQLRVWRNSQHVRRFMLSDELITPEQQQAWFEHIQRAQNQHHFVIEYKGKPIGSCNIKTRGHEPRLQSAQHFECGLYIGEAKYNGNIIAFAPTLVMNDYCFDKLKAKRLHAVVKSDNTAALRYNEKLGYQVVVNGDLIEIELDRANYERSSATLKQFLNRQKTKK